MHQLKKGPANQSYGIQVAQLAGVPSDVIAIAKQKLSELELTRQNSNIEGDIAQADLFNSIQEPTELEQYLAQLNPDELSPKQALEALYKASELLNKPS